MQTIVTTVNVAVMVFIVIAGLYVGFKTGGVGYELPNGVITYSSHALFMVTYTVTGLMHPCIFSRYFPFGVNGVFAGSATLFYSYVGFDSVTSTAEEVYFE